MQSKAEVICIVAILTVVGCLGEDCPPPEALDRCKCHVDNEGLPCLECPNVEEWDDISFIFDTDLVSHFGSVNIYDSPNLSSLPDKAFSDVKINTLKIYQTGLQQLDKSVFTGAQENSITMLSIKYNSNFTTFDNTLSGLVALEVLDMSNNNFQDLTGHMDGKRPGLPTLDLSHNHINYIEPNYFSYLNDLGSLSLAFNNLTTDDMTKNTLTIYDGAPEFYLDLGYNDLSEGLPASALGGEVKPNGLVLSHNNIRFLNESLFVPTIEAMMSDYEDNNSTFVLLDGNDLECGCEMKWVVHHPAGEILEGGTCHDGRLVSELTDADFADC